MIKGRWEGWDRKERVIIGRWDRNEGVGLGRILAVGGEVRDREEGWDIVIWRREGWNRNERRVG